MRGARPKPCHGLSRGATRTISSPLPSPHAHLSRCTHALLSSYFQTLTVARVFPFLFRPSQTRNQTTMADAEALQKLRDENAAMEKEIMELTKKSDTVGTKSSS